MLKIGGGVALRLISRALDMGGGLGRGAIVQGGLQGDGLRAGDSGGRFFVLGKQPAGRDDKRREARQIGRDSAPRTRPDFPPFVIF